MTVGVIVHGLDDDQRRQAYAADITYGTNNEFGFDYLRDNMKYDMAQMVQRGHAFAIVDEVDSILVDEARTPLIISGPSEDRSGLYVAVDTIIPAACARRLRARREAAHRQSHRGRQRARRGAAALDGRDEGRVALRGGQRDPCPSRQSGAARAQAFPARQGLHRPQRRGRDRRRVHRPHDARAGAIRKACIRRSRPRKGVTVQPENVTLASITFQNYFRLYKKLAGMTGTAATEADEFAEIYKLVVVEIPTNSRSPGSTRTTKSIGLRKRRCAPSCARSRPRTPNCSRCWSARRRSRSPKCSARCWSSTATRRSISRRRMR